MLPRKFLFIRTLSNFLFVYSMPSHEHPDVWKCLFAANKDKNILKKKIIELEKDKRSLEKDKKSLIKDKESLELKLLMYKSTITEMSAHKPAVPGPSNCNSNPDAAVNEKNKGETREAKTTKRDDALRRPPKNWNAYVAKLDEKDKRVRTPLPMPKKKSSRSK